jgi:hypothetical protein
MDDDDIAIALDELAEDLGFTNLDTALWFLADKFGYDDVTEVETIIWADPAPVTCLEDMLETDRTDARFTST